MSMMQERQPERAPTVTLAEWWRGGAPPECRLPLRVDQYQIAGVTLERIKEAPQGTVSAKSATFSALGRNWHLQAHFNMSQGDPAMNCFGLLLYLDSPAATESVKLRITCGSFTHEIPPYAWSTSVPQPANSCRGRGSKNLTHAQLTANPGDYIVDGVMTFNATLTATGLAAASIGPLQRYTGSAVAVAQPSLAADMRLLLSGTRGCPFDVKLLCADGELVPAHSCILALRSGVFSAMFAADSGLAPVDRDRIPVPPEITSATLRRVLEFIYCDDLTPASAEEAQHLLNAADQYQLSRLKSICERTLCEQLSVENVGIVLALASQHHARALERQAILFAARNAAAVLRTDGWAHLLSTAKPELSTRIMLAMATGEVPDEAAATGAADGSGGSGGGGTGASSAGVGGSGANKRPRRNR